MTTVRDAPEFHLVVRRPGRRSPLAPYRFVVTFLFAMGVCGLPLWEAVESGGSIDEPLLRLSGAALFAWFVLGRVNSILSSPPTTTTVLPTDLVTPAADRAGDHGSAADPSG